MAIVNLPVHCHHADCCLTIHDQGLLDKDLLFLDYQGEGGVKCVRIKRSERTGGETERKIALTIMQHCRSRGKTGKCYGQPSN